MKQTKKLYVVAAIMAVIGFLALPLTGCDGEDDSGTGGYGGASGGGGSGAGSPGGSGGGSSPATNGSLTINGLSAYNGKYVMAESYGNDDYGFIASENMSYNSNTKAITSITGGEITGGSVTLKVWKSDNGITSYSGNDNNIVMTVYIYNSKEVLYNPGLIGYGTVTISFSGGKATGTITEITSP